MYACVCVWSAGDGGGLTIVASLGPNILPPLSFLTTLCSS